MVLHPYCLLEQGLDFDIGCPLRFPFLVQFPLLDKGGYFASWNLNQCQNGRFCRKQDLQQK